MNSLLSVCCYFFFFQAEDGIRDSSVTGVQTCALPISAVDERARRQLRDELGERLPRRSEQLEQVAQARDRVVGRQELREDVAAADRAREADAVLRRGARQPGERGGRAAQLRRAALDDLRHPPPC